MVTKTVDIWQEVKNHFKDKKLNIILIDMGINIQKTLDVLNVNKIILLNSYKVNNISEKVKCVSSNCFYKILDKEYDFAYIGGNITSQRTMDYLDDIYYVMNNDSVIAGENHPDMISAVQNFCYNFDMKLKIDKKYWWFYKYDYKNRLVGYNK